MNDSSRNQGGLICIGAGAAALLFVIGVLRGSYLALAIPVTVLTLFALGLDDTAGSAIYTVQVEPENGAGPPAGGAAPPTVPPSPPNASDASR